MANPERHVECSEYLTRQELKDWLLDHQRDLFEPRSTSCCPIAKFLKSKAPGSWVSVGATKAHLFNVDGQEPFTIAIDLDDWAIKFIAEVDYSFTQPVTAQAIAELI